MCHFCAYFALKGGDRLTAPIFHFSPHTNTISLFAHTQSAMVLEIQDLNMVRFHEFYMDVPNEPRCVSEFWQLSILCVWHVT